MFGIYRVLQLNRVWRNNLLVGRPVSAVMAVWFDRLVESDGDFEYDGKSCDLIADSDTTADRSESRSSTVS